MKELLTSDHSQIEAIQYQLLAAFETGIVENIFEKLDIFWARLAIHIRAEHLHLFPAILKASQVQIFEKNRIWTLASVQSAIKQLHDDHDFFMKELGTVIKQMRVFCKTNVEATSEQLSEMHEKVSAVSRRLEKHNELEESQVYRWAEELLDQTEQLILNKLIQTELENLPPRFEGNRNGSSKRLSD